MSPNLLLSLYDLDMLEAVATALTDESYRVTRVSHQRAALAELERASFDLVIAELLPVGDQPLAQLGALQRKAAPAPVGLITSAELHRDVLERLGFVFALQMPFSTEELLEAVGRHAMDCPLDLAE